MKANKKTIRRGHCERFTLCSKADNGEVQEVALGEDFVCSECGSELVEEPPKSSKKWLWSTCCVVAIVAVVVLLVRMCGSNDDDGFGIVVYDTVITDCLDTIVMSEGDTLWVVENTRTDSIVTIKRDTLIVKGCDTVEVKPYKKTDKTPKKKRGVENEWDSYDNDGVAPVYGKYSGPRDSNGDPHGSGGRVVITMHYYYGVHLFEPGDIITNTTYEHGSLKGGTVAPTKGKPYKI